MENPFKKAVENKDEEINEVETAESDTAETPEETSQEDSSEAEEPADPWKEKYEQLNNQYIRLAADFDNFRKRQEKTAP